ncbi:hypothetical protein RM549_00435 [Salegentibacter sp. F188]|uniref:Uncharacterized protein n=1 Tax=Autumnicola patrickiae TaxID=3075591 RepID=A0ABU3DWX9_9FLAO|nr:hypothetical protein [Salegentibacter sp. F188]MDT0688235.1 hypothetical protein [Salegentibacter sp. F188]
MKLSITRLFFLLSIFIFTGLNAQQTSVMVRAKAKDAKFIGSSIGGAKIYIKNAETGEILAEGLTTGSTGNTDKIMNSPWKRNEDLSEENTAGFLANIDIDEPVFVTVEAHAPINKKQATVISSTQLWLIPGKDITGDGVVLEVPGFVVDILSPQTHERIPETNEVQIMANIVLMCGCPVTEGGIWDANQYEVKALISSEGEQIQELEMTVGEKPSTFSAKKNLNAGLYGITVYAFDPVTGNTGVDKTNIIIN